MRLFVSFSALMFLVACTSPRDACITAAQAELRAIDAQIAEGETALARGYRLSQATESRTTLHLCAWPREPVLFCTQHTPGQRATRVIVDPAVEHARLAALRQDRARAVAASADRISACPV